ncbi:MAG TPA: hypothetical protein VHW02_14140 [Rhizomicrobium sp.]|jgi:hypothetical protein|nr:hypothetical protein [Rhizomicrobium sp.]
MKTSTLICVICDTLAIVAWGSVGWIFGNAFYFQYSHGYLSGWHDMKFTTGMAIITLIWIGVPIIAFLLSLILPLWLVTKGRTDSAQKAAILLFALGLPWAALQWFFLGAG